MRALRLPTVPCPISRSIEALEARANQAQPREQCFLYAQLVQQMTELSIRQYAGRRHGQGNRPAPADPAGSRKKIHLSVADNDKRLKNAEILLSHTAFRLNEMLQASSIEDRPLVEQTLAQVTQAQECSHDAGLPASSSPVPSPSAPCP